MTTIAAPAFANASFTNASFTGMSFTNASFGFAAPARSPRLSLAARLATLQARQEQAPHLSGLFGVASRFALALVPFVGLTWVFVTI